jgi:hypothetical protein
VGIAGRLQNSWNSTVEQFLLREQRIAGTRSLPILGPAAAWQCRTKAMLFMGQDSGCPFSGLAMSSETPEASWDEPAFLAITR